MTNNFNKITCCFTGHRPNKMNYTENEIKPHLKNAINTAIDNGYTFFITGMAEGVDIWAAETLLDYKKTFKNIKLICAVPYPGFHKNRSIAEINRYKNILNNADYIKWINSHYFRGCYQVRNKWMVDLSTLVIAVYNGQKSGTKNTVEYAQQKGIKVINLINENQI